MDVGRRVQDGQVGPRADAQVEAASAVRTAAPAIAEAAALVVTTLSSGGRLVYAAAGSSGLMALADGLELPGTYQIPQDRVVVERRADSESLERQPL